MLLSTPSPTFPARYPTPYLGALPSHSLAAPVKFLGGADRSLVPEATKTCGEAGDAGRQAIVVILRCEDAKKNDVV